MFEALPSTPLMLVGAVFLKRWHGLIFYLTVCFKIS